MAILVVFWGGAMIAFIGIALIHDTFFALDTNYTHEVSCGGYSPYHGEVCE